MPREVKKGNLLKTTRTKAAYRKDVIEKRDSNWKNKPMHGQYLQDIEGKADKNLYWGWLKSGVLKKETECFILAAQEQGHS